jgi:hypothetical protein
VQFPFAKGTWEVTVAPTSGHAVVSKKGKVRQQTNTVILFALPMYWSAGSAWQVKRGRPGMHRLARISAGLMAPLSPGDQVEV